MKYFLGKHLNYVAYLCLLMSIALDNGEQAVKQDIARYDEFDYFT